MEQALPFDAKIGLPKLRIVVFGRFVVLLHRVTSHACASCFLVRRSPTGAVRNEPVEEGRRFHLRAPKELAPDLGQFVRGESDHG